MPEKLGNGGYSQEKYDAETGKYTGEGQVSESEKRVLNSMGLSDKEVDPFEKYKKIEEAQNGLKESYEKMIGNDKNRLHIYREWGVNSNDEYKRRVYNDLKNGSKENALQMWYNWYKLKSGDYDLTYEQFLKTPMKLYRATNVNEKEDAKNPFFSYAQTRENAERFLSGVQSLYLKRTGEVEEIKITPEKTLGMIPSDEQEIAIPNPKYEELSDKITSLEQYAADRGVELPYDHDTLFDHALNGVSFEQLEEAVKKYVDKRSAK